MQLVVKQFCWQKVSRCVNHQILSKYDLESTYVWENELGDLSKLDTSVMKTSFVVPKLGRMSFNAFSNRFCLSSVRNFSDSWVLIADKSLKAAFRLDVALDSDQHIWPVCIREVTDMSTLLLANFSLVRLERFLSYTEFIVVLNWLLRNLNKI